MLLRFLIILSFVFACCVYAWMNPRTLPEPADTNFVKMDADGRMMNVWAGPWNCVLDKRSSLLWAIKTDSESIHDGYWTYSWFQDETGVGVENSGDCFFEDNRCDTSDLIRRANAEKTCGKTGWRLPTTAELSQLVFLQSRPGEPAIDQDFFPHMQRSNYWTSDANVSLDAIYAHTGPGANAVNFNRGEIVALPYHNAAFVILVTDQQ